MANRILVYGVTGSGKTTLAAQISLATGIPWHSVDDLTWDPGWKEIPLEVQRERIQAICDSESWILDTAYGKWKEIPLNRVELIVALDYPRWVSFGRLLIRCIKRIVDRRPICNGNFESIRNTFFSKDSILIWHFRSFVAKRRRIESFEADPQSFVVLRHRSPRAAQSWLESLKEPSRVL